MAAYYNEIDLFAAKWLRNLMKEGLIPDGEIDTRSIVDVRPSDLVGFKQCHFFAGIAGWSRALRLAGWADDRKIWTGSCPCQPFSVAGKGKGTADERHLWPVFFNLIRECRPPVVMGEQVAGKAGYGWFDGVRTDLEGEGYASRAVDVCAASVGAPHIRQRLYWVAVADADQGERGRRPSDGECLGDGTHTGWPQDQCDAARRSEDRHNLANSYDDGAGCFSRASVHEGRKSVGAGAKGLRFADWTGLPDRVDARNSCNLADAKSISQREPHDDQRAVSREDARSSAGGGGERHSVWADAVWLTGADGKARRAKPGISLLADGVPARVGRLRAYGNAIVPPLAAVLIESLMDVLEN